MERNILKWYKSTFVYTLAVLMVLAMLGPTWASEDGDQPATGVKTKVETKRVLIPYKLERRVDPKLTPGTVKVLQAGSNGWKERTTQISYLNDKIIKQEVIEEKILEKPVNKIILAGEKKITASERGKVIKTSRGTYRYRNVLTMHATAYSPMGKWGNRTATGITARHGVVAVDPKVIPLGTRLYVEGYGPALAADTGGAIKGHKIDLFYESYFQAMRFGRQNLDVYVLE